MRAAVLRLLRQDPWECLASFILSSTKQIVQIRQIVGLLCERFGGAISAAPEYGPVYAFPGAGRLARGYGSGIAWVQNGVSASRLTCFRVPDW